MFSDFENKNTKEKLIDINEHIDQVIIVSEKGNSYA